MDFKDMVARGIYYNSIGSGDYLTWSKKMFDYYGSEIGSHMKYIRKWSVVIQNSIDYKKVLKLNCWQFMGCQLQKKGRLFQRRKKPYACPSLSEKKFDGVHGGINGGRACWIVPHTICCGTIQGTYEEKFRTCPTCDFYRSVVEEEENNFMGSDVLRAMLM